MTAILDWLAETSPWVSLLLKLTALLAAAWGVHFCLARTNPQWRVLLWRAVAVGLVIVPLAQFAGPKLDLVVSAVPAEQRFSTVPSMDSTVRMEPGQAVPAAVSAAESPTTEYVSPVSLAQGALAVWVLGVVVLFGRSMLARRGLRNLLRQADPAPEYVGDLLNRVVADLEVRRKPSARITLQMVSPFLAGLVRPTIVLPGTLVEESRVEDLRSILAHEASHLRTNDLAWNGLLRITSALLWFHPFAWGMRAAHMSACEQVCDAAAAKYTGDARTYSRVLARSALDLLVATPPAASIPLVRTSDIGHRLRRLQLGIGWESLSRMKVWPVMAVILIAASVVASVQFVRAEEKPAGSSEETGAVEGQVIIGGVPQANQRLGFFRYDTKNRIAHEASTTDSEGKFKLRGLSSGKYLFSMYSPEQVDHYPTGALTPYYGAHVDVLPGVTNEVKIGGSGVRIVGKLVPVPNSSGKTVSPLAMQSSRLVEDAILGDPKVGPPGLRIALDIAEDGNFVIHDVPQGRYKFGLKYTGVSPSPRGGRVTSFVALATPNTIEVPEKTDDGQLNVGTVEYRLEEESLNSSELKTGTVQGQVFIGDKPAGMVQVLCSPYDVEIVPPPMAPPMPTDSEGRFSFKGLPPGKYQFAQMKSWQVEQKDWSTTMGTGSHGVYVEVLPGVTTEVKIGGSGAKVVGKLAPIPNGTGKSVPPLALSYRRLEGQVPRGDFKGNIPGLLFIMDVQKDGTFEIPDVPPGRYKIGLECMDRELDPAGIPDYYNVQAVPGEIEVTEESDGKVLDVGTVEYILADTPFAGPGATGATNSTDLRFAVTPLFPLRKHVGVPVPFGWASGSKLTLAAEVINSGTVSLTSWVSFYSGNPEKGGAFIGESSGTFPGGTVPVTISHTGPDGKKVEEISTDIPAQPKTRVVSVDWDASPGEQEVYAVLDPKNLIAESDEDNNLAHRWVHVVSEEDAVAEAKQRDALALDSPAKTNAITDAYNRGDLDALIPFLDDPDEVMVRQQAILILGQGYGDKPRKAEHMELIQKRLFSASSTDRGAAATALMSRDDEYYEKNRETILLMVTQDPDPRIRELVEGNLKRKLGKD